MIFGHDTIQDAYQRLGYDRGWTFMATPEARLYDARVTIVGLNPGGGGPGDTYDYEGLWDAPGGNAYFTEKWGPNGTETPIQAQVRAWHSLLGISADETVCAQFVPFRSRNWDSLPRKQEAIRFADSLWSWVLQITPSTLFITMGKRPAEHLARLTDGRKIGRLPANWGKQTIEVYDAANNRRIVAMPHPSRFTLFGRGESGALAEQSFRSAAGLDAWN